MAINYIQKAGGSVELVFRTPLKLREHLRPEKYPLPLRDPITPFWRVKKLERLSRDRGIPVSFPKPKWLLEDQKK
jgi:large subunit ribosomal protein L15